MHQDKAIGMFMGLFIGDALGAPLEFIRPHEMTKTLTEMEGGGVHNTAEGEWTDDGAMAVAIADAYISKGGFAPSDAQRDRLPFLHSTSRSRAHRIWRGKRAYFPRR